MKHSQSLPTTAWGTTQTWDSNIPDTQRACTNIGKLFTLIIAIFILGNTNVNAQACGTYLPANTSNCAHPADSDNTSDGSEMFLVQSTNYVDLNGNAVQDTGDGAYTDLSAQACNGQVFSGSILSGGTYGFNLNSGRGYTFEVCGATADIYPLMDLWTSNVEPVTAPTTDLAATSGAPVNGCVSFVYNNIDTEVFLSVNSQVHGNTCQADWREWTLTVSCSECEITCASDVYVTASSSTGNTCEAASVVATTPTISGECDATPASLTILSSTLDASLAGTMVTPDVAVTYTGPFMAGAYNIVYQALDCAGNTYTCTQNIIVEPIMVCNDEVNITMGANCAVTITADMIVEAPCTTDDNYLVTIVGLSSNTVEIPGTYTVKVEYAPLTGSGRLLTGIYCWGDINVEDKTGPICTSTQEQYTGFCGGEVVTTTPVFTDCTGLANDTIIYDQAIGSCGEFTGNNITVNFASPTNSGGYIAELMPAGVLIPYPTTLPPLGFTLDNVVIRTWQMSDILGNGSVSCKQYIYNWRPSAANILTPLPNIELECLSDIDVATLAAADVQFVPHFADPLNAGEFLPMLAEGHASCKYSVSFSDVPLVELCGQTRKVLREWTVLDWCTGALVINQFTQIIKTVDTIAPVWDNCPDSDPDDDTTTDDAEPGSTMDNPLTLNSSSSSADNCFFFGTLNAPTATDVCGDVTYSAEIYTPTGGLDYILQDLSQPAQIGFGLRRVVFVATDDCGNRAECPIFYDVLDDDQPIAICDQFTTVSLTNALEGGARICADNLDSGSYDNCAITSRTVRRMDADEATPFTDCIDLTCSDVANSPIMVVMRVADAAGNFNDCMVEVEVQDKIGPFLTCPADVTITCTDDIYDLGLTGDVAVGSTSPLTLGGGYAFDNCGETLVRDYEDDLTDLACGAGVVTRTWTVTSNGSTVSCEQDITITSINSFRVEFPRDTVITTCTSPENLGDFGAPIITNDICAQVGVGSTDVQFDVVSGACYKILRTWTVVNWCNYSDENLTNTASGNAVADTELTFDDDGDGYFRYTQVIKVQDAVAPVFSPFASNTAFLNTTDECGGTVAIQVAANDSCSDDITYEYLIDADNDGTFEPSLRGTGAVIDPTVVFPYGNHRVLFIAEDGCGNTSSQEIEFSIADNKAPNIACQHLSVTLMPGVNMIEMWASDYVETSGVSDNCTATEDLVYGVIRVSDSDQTTPPTTTNITFDCTDLQIDTNGDGTPDDAPISAEVEIEIWIGDTDGNWTFCTATTTVFANDDGCDPNPDNAKVMVAGDLKNEFGNDLEDVTIEISSEESMWDYTTENDGHYEIDELPMYTNFTVTPENDTNPLNGVSTYDLVLLSQHILGINELDSPYTMIAADVNNNGTITTADIVELRQMILYITSDFQNNKSWRFVDAGFVFPDQTNPFTTSFPEVRNLNALENNAMAENFVGIKVGDLNGDAVANSVLGAEDRNLVGAFTMKANDQLVAAGEEVTLTLTSEDLATVEGFQFTLNFDATALEFEEVGNSDLVGFTAGNFGYNFLNEGVLTASWNKVADAEVANQVVELVFTAKDDITLSEVISLSSRYTKAEAYDADMNDMNVGLEFNTSNGTVITATGFELYQNQPNPFSNETSIGFTLPEAASASLTIYDVEGRELRVITNSFAKGYNQFTVDNKNLIGGVLYYRLDTPTHSATKKMIVIK